jgi:hypothetical protein
MRRKHLRPAAIAIAAVLSIPALAAADAPPGPYFNGFETNTAGWFNLSGAQVNREASGYMSDNGYASGVPSQAGGWHARLRQDPSPDSCTFGGGTAPIYYGPYTNWGGYGSFFPPGGYTTRVDVYLDVEWAKTHVDKRFDWSSAVNTPSGSHRRDFVFNAGTDPLGFVISASNNSTRCGAFPGNPGRGPIQISASGWYTFKHTFTGAAGGPLMALLTVSPAGSNTPLGTWVLSDSSDIIGATVGGNRYGWFVQNEIDELAIDNSERTGFVSTPGCEIKISDGGYITAQNGDRGSFGGNAKVSASGTASGEQTYHDHGPVQPLDFKALTVQAVICNNDGTAEIYGSGTVNGLSSEYRIQLDDNGEPGTSDRYGITITTAGYTSGYKTLEGGNIQIKLS